MRRSTPWWGEITGGLVTQRFASVANLARLATFRMNHLFRLQPRRDVLGSPLKGPAAGLGETACAGCLRP